jgi:hypothetical protein
MKVAEEGSAFFTGLPSNVSRLTVQTITGHGMN